MSKVLKARVIRGRYQGEIVRVSNVSLDELGRKSAACTLSSGQRANIRAEDLELVQEETAPEPEVRRAKTASMPFLSGSTGSRSMNQTRSLVRKRSGSSPVPVVRGETLAVCESCGGEFNLEERKGKAGKLTQCELCAEETETPVEGQMIFSHKTGATIEIKKDGELRHEAPIFDPKNKTS
jgi:hypothetical protein